MEAETAVFGGSLMHSDDPKPDFSGYATKAGLKCSDGRTIMPDAFKHQDKAVVPLVWQHNHGEPENILGHAVLENRDDGVYAYGYFNDTPTAKNALALVKHGDIKSLSIYANQLTERTKQVLHGIIREVSLVLSGANPGAFIDNITLAHADGEKVTLEDEAVIYTGLALAHDDQGSPGQPSGGSEDDGPTVQEVYDTMNDDQKQVVQYMVGAALEEGKTGATPAQTPAAPSVVPAAAGVASHSSTPNPGDKEKEGRRMTRNVFEQERSNPKEPKKQTLSHDAMKGIFEDAQKRGSLKEAVEDYALKHGIENIDVLFPDAKSLTSTPEFDSRRVEWVRGVLGGTRHSPFTRIKSIVADITFDEARARGYIKGNLKKEEWFAVSKRTTSPTTIYKKQKLDRDDIIDITDFNVVVWLQGEMRLMLDEELARAVLIGDGREVEDDDKIKDPAGASEGAGIRSILNEHELYAAQVHVNLGDASSNPTEIVDNVVSAMRLYKGSGSPTFYTTQPVITSLLLIRDSLGRRLYSSLSEIAAEMGVAAIVPVEVMESEEDLIGIIVNLSDYTIGTDQGGEVNFFDFFDIDYNQYKYLLETRVSGALTKIRSALVVRKTAGSDVAVTPAAPDFDPSDGSVSINDTTHVVYKRADTNATVDSNSTITVDAGKTLKIYATAATGYYIANGVKDEWTFLRPPA